MGCTKHKDKRDCRRTVWLCNGTGALVHVFPEYEHILHLHPGDIIVFNGEGSPTLTLHYAARSPEPSPNPNPNPDPNPNPIANPNLNPNLVCQH